MSGVTVGAGVDEGPAVTATDEPMIHAAINHDKCPWPERPLRREFIRTRERNAWDKRILVIVTEEELLRDYVRIRRNATHILIEAKSSHKA